jgi:CBS domain-containing protein
VDERSEFLARFEPFAGFDDDDLARVAASVTVLDVAAGDEVLVEDGAPARSLFVIRSGAMELLHEGEIVDVLASGESFGHPSLLSGLAPAFTVRAHEASVVYAIPRDLALEVLGRPAGARYVASSLRERLTRTGHVVHALPQVAGVAVATLGRAPVFCDPETSIREVAREMTRRGVTAVLLRIGRELAMVTDRDIRERVVADGVSADAPVGTIALAAVTASDRALALDAMIDMLEAGVHHLAIVDPRGTVVSLVAADDLLSVESRSPFALRRALAQAPDVDALAEVAGHLRDLFVALVAAGLAPPEIGRVLALQSDTATARLIDLAIEEHGQPPCAWAWLALGSVARREVTLASDQDNALAYDGGEGVEAADAYFARFGAFVNGGLARCGFGPDAAEVLAGDARWRMSPRQWESVFRECLAHPDRSHLVRAAVSFDFRHVVGGLDIAGPLVEILRRAREYPDFVAALARTATDFRPPLRFRGHIREKAGKIDLKLGAVVPIANLARFHALSNGITISATLDRLVAAEEVGALDRATAQALREAFTIVSRVRLEHHAVCVAAARQPDNLVEPSELAPLARAELREALRAVAGAQKQLARFVPLGRL